MNIKFLVCSCYKKQLEEYFSKDTLEIDFKELIPKCEHKEKILFQFKGLLMNLLLKYNGGKNVNSR